MKKLLFVLATSLYLAGCGGGGAGGAGAAAAPDASSLSAQGDGLTTAQIGRVTIRDNEKGPFTLMGTISGLLGDGLALDDGWGIAAMMQKSTIFAFIGHVPANSEYSVRVARQPVNPTQSCTIENNHGRATTTVSNMAVNCVLAAKFAIVAKKTPAGGVLETFAYDQTTGMIGEKPLKSEPLLGAETDSSKSLRLLRNPKKSTVYLVSEERKMIEPFAVDERTGALKRLDWVSYETPRDGIAINSSGTRIYSLNAGGSKLIVSSLGESGEFVKGQYRVWNLTGGDSLTSLLGSADDKHLYATSKSGVVITFDIEEDGTPSQSATITGYLGLNGLAISPKFDFAFASRDNWNSIAFLKLDQTGEITSITNYSYDGIFSNLKGLTFDPTGAFLFGIDGTRNSLFMFKIDKASGEPTLTSVRAVDANSSAAVSVDPQGRFVYVSASSGSGFVRAFSIDAKTDSLTEVQINQGAGASAFGVQLY